MSERKVDWIHIQKPDGKNYITHPNNLKKLLGVEKNETSIHNIFNRINYLETKVHRLESPKRQQRVIELLTEDGKPHMLSWLKNRVNNLDLTDVMDMVRNDVLSHEKRGRNSMYFLTSINNGDKRSV